MQKNKRKYKPKSKTPIVIGLTKKQLDTIKQIPRRSLIEFKESPDSDESATNWYNFTFRIRTGYDIALNVYVQETSDQFKSVFDTCMSILQVFKDTGKWLMSEEEYEFITCGLDAVDQISDENIRRIQLDSFHNTDKFMKCIVKEFNDQYSVKA